MGKSEDKNEGTYYWIKLSTKFFEENTPIDVLMGMGQPNGSEYVALYLKLCLMTANSNGKLLTKIGDMLIPYNVEKIVRDAKYFSRDTVIVAMEMYSKLGLIYQDDDGILSIANYDKLVGKETKWAEYKRNSRKRLDNVQQESKALPGQSLDNVQQEYREKEYRDNTHTHTNNDVYIPPTLGEVIEYCKEHAANVDPLKFHHYYASLNWMIDGEPMWNWKERVQFWKDMEREKFMKHG